MNTTIAYTNAQIIAPPQTGLEAFVGHTPLLPLRRFDDQISPGVQVFTKAEWFNPGGSVKDRPALHIMRNALVSGQLSGSKRLLDSTSGNMGIAYATLGAAMDVAVTLAIPANASPERITILRALGAELIVTDALEGADGAIRVARKLAAEQPERYYYANQYDNPASWQAHYDTTGPEIMAQTHGKITHLVAGLGTSGTLTGAARYLLGWNPDLKVIAVQPDAPFHGLEGLKHMATALQPGIFDPSLIDQVVEITTEEAYAAVQTLARREGLFVGISSGAAAAAAFKVARELQHGVVVTVFPDAGYKYLSEPSLWERTA